MAILELRVQLAQLEREIGGAQAEIWRCDAEENAFERLRLQRRAESARRELAIQRTRLFYRRALRELIVEDMQQEALGLGDTSSGGLGGRVFSMADQDAMKIEDVA